jgi:predicted metalloprotease with PDZ domain
MKQRTFIAFFAFLMLVVGAHGQTIPEMSYVLTPVPQLDKTYLRVELRFKPTDAKPLSVKLPVDCFGTPDLYKYVRDFRGDFGTIVRPGKTAAERIAEPDSDGYVSVSYTLSYDPAVMQGSPYAPASGSDYVHLAGCQWLLPIGDDKEEREFNVEIRKVPRGWKMYSSSSSHPAKFTINTSYDDLSSAAIGGGITSHVFYTGKSRVSVFAHGSLGVPQANIYRSIEQIVRLQRKWFEDDGQSDYTIIVAPRSGFRAGFAPDNMFVCFVDPETSATALNLLVAHEFFHNWLPNKIDIVQDGKYSRLRYEWFTEGFPEYFAHKILRDAGLISEREFVDSVNANILNIADNPNRSKTYDELVQMGKEGRFDGDAKKLAYFRGFLIALDWDFKMKLDDPSRDLSRFMRDLYRIARSDGGKVPESEFFTLAGRYGIKAPEDISQYIMKGQPIEPDRRALGTAFVLEGTRRPRFTAGFDVAATLRARVVTGVNAAGPAYKAGLREGMTFIDVDNVFRFSNAWRRDKPVTVKVKVDGKQETIEYWPHGEDVNVSLFVPAT